MTALGDSSFLALALCLISVTFQDQLGETEPGTWPQSQEGPLPPCVHLNGLSLHLFWALVSG